MVFALPRPVRRPLLAARLRLKERTLAREIGSMEVDSGPDAGLPVPPPDLRVLVSGPGAERETWLRTGATDAELIRRLLLRNGYGLEAMSSVLDFGCGCGRVARHWADLQGPALHGADASGRLAGWCDAQLPFMRAIEIDPHPPLPYASREFDFAYALSVLTHLSEEAGRTWAAELVRVLKPGGLLLFTVQGARFAPVLDESQQRRFRSGEVVTRLTEIAGTNSCAAYHPAAYIVEDLIPAFDLELIEAVYEDPTGGTVVSPMPLQDNYLVRKRAA
jgi:SAM-dependent methyltransferase